MGRKVKKSKDKKKLDALPTHFASVIWGDAWEEDAEIHISEARDNVPYTKATTGYILAENDNGLVLAQEINVPDRTVLNRTHVPKGMIVRIRRMKLPDDHFDSERT